MSTPEVNVGQLVGHYRILEKIGGGGQGEVFRAHDERFDRDVALKILPVKAFSDEAARKRFRQEAQAVGKLSHPNIATAFYFGEENGIDFLVTEYISGARLDEQLSNGPLPEETILALGAELASGLAAAHLEGIIHRDLKPGNLRITAGGQLKILDFGLAELVDPGTDVASAETVTLTMTLTGTLPYMAPEQFDGISDQRTDLWAAGVVLYELATGQLPFPQTQLQRLKDAIQHQEPKRPTGLNPAISTGLECVILRAVQKDPKLRYQTAKELHDDLVRVAQGRTIGTGERLRGSRLTLALVTVLLASSAFALHHFWPQIRQMLGPQPPAGSSFRVLAVLPIETDAGDASENALVRGVAETVSARIAQGTNGRTFQLIPPNELRAQGVTTAEAARKAFGVDRVLTVALQRSPDKIRVTCSLIDPKTHQQMDARTVTGYANDLFALEDNSVADVFAMLPQDARSEQPAPSEVHAAEPAAYEYYVRGRGYLLDYQKTENIDSAIKQFEQALKLSPNFAPAYAGLGEAYWQRYKADHNKAWLDKATANCGKALAADPKLAEGHLCLGNVSRTRGEYDKALQEINQAVAADPNNVMAVMALGDTFDKLDNYSEAESTFKKATALSPNYWAAYNWAGFFYYGRANYTEAEKMFRKASDLAPGNNMVRENLGGIYLLEGRYQDAIDVLQGSAQIRETVTTYSDLGAAYFYLHKFPESITALRKATELDGQNYVAIGNLADALYWSVSRRAEAAEVYRKAIALAKASAKINPKDSGALSCIASYSAMVGEREAALSALEQALLVGPSDPDVMFRAAVVHNHYGEREQTLEWLRRASAAGFSRSTIRDSPDFASIQQDPAFRAIVSASH